MPPSKKQIERALLPEFAHFADLFMDKDDTELPLHRPDMNYAINLTKDEQERTHEISWGPLYGIARDELLVLRKTLTDHLDKNWIRASSFPGEASVLFVKKPEEGLRFYMDYRALNALTEKNRYPFPLIWKTLRSLSKARWLTKVDVRAAFHKLRIKEGDEWKTVFRTKFGLFEWLVTPFGLTKAPATFQRYINSVLQKHLDNCCSAYLNDMLIYSNEDYNDHMKKVSIILEKLRNAKLSLDLEKSEFAVTETKYLGFVIRVGEGITVDLSKVAAIRAWEAPIFVKGVRSFLGFANFYREFIENFSDIAALLLNLTKKRTFWRWERAEQKSFERFKELFITAPILALWNPNRETVMKCDCSGWAIKATIF
jgi:hypothetical protein